MRYSKKNKQLSRSQIFKAGSCFPFSFSCFQIKTEPYPWKAPKAQEQANYPKRCEAGSSHL